MVNIISLSCPKCNSHSLYKYGKDRFGTTHVLRSFRVSMKTPEHLTTELSEDLRLTDKSCFEYEITADSKLKVAALEKICIGNSIEGALIIPQTITNNKVSDADRKCLTLCANTIAKILN